MIESKAKSYQNDDNSKKFWKISKRKPIKITIFELYRQLYHKTDIKESSITLQKFKLAIEGIIWSLQIISLLWIPDMSITNWSKNMIIWEIIGYLKFDNVCSELGIMRECLISSILFTFTSFFSIIIFIIIIYCSYKIPTYILSVFHSIFRIWASFFLLPSVQVFTIFLKYNIFSIDRIAEYQNNNDSANLEINLVWVIGIILSMIFAIILILFYTQFSGEIRHSLHKSTITAKAHSIIETHIAIFTYFMPILYVILAQNFIIYLQILTLIFSVTLIKETLILWPYFSFYSNSIIILRLFFIAFISFTFILGRLMDNSLAISLIAFILEPLLSIFILQFLLKSQKKITQNIPNSIQNINSQYDLEKSLRYALCFNDIENKDKIIQIFENFFLEKKLNGTKLQVIWEANYCLYTLEDNSLTKIKLAKNKKISDLNLEANYQEYLCNKNILNNSISDSLNFSNFFIELQLVKKQDKKLCINLLNFLNEIISSKPNLSHLKSKLNSIDKTISVLNKEYNELSIKYASSKEALSLYTSYLSDIACDLKKSASIELKIKSIDRASPGIMNDNNNFSCFNCNNGVLIFSNESENFGEILYANNKSAEIFRLPLSNFINDNFFNFLHPYYKDRIINEAKKFTYFSTSLEIDLTKGFFLNLPMNLLECFGKMSVNSINNSIISILIFREKEIKHQVALISDDFEIICHSTNFQRFLGKIDNNLIGANIKKLFFFSEEFDLKPFAAYRLSQFLDEIYLVLSYYEFYGIKISYILLIKGKEEIEKWSSCELIQNNSNNIGLLQIGSSLLSVKLSEPLASYRNTSLLQVESQPEENLDSRMHLFDGPNEDQENNKLLDINNDDEKSQHSISNSQNKFLNMVRISSKSINVLHLSFIFSILTVLAVNIAVLIYGFITINEISNIDLPLYIGRTGKNFQQISLLPQMILWILFANVPETIVLIPEINAKFLGSIANFEIVYTNITLNSKNWNYCSGQSIINDANVDLWHIDNGIYTKKANLISTSAQFIKNGKEFESKLNDSSLGSPWDPFRFLLLNGYGSALNYCYNSLNDIIDCQKSTMNDFKTKMGFLLATGPIVLAVCILLAIPFFMYNLKIENELWSNLRKNIYSIYFEYKQKIFDRLRYIHSEENVPFSDQKPSKTAYTFKSYWRFTWRTLIFFAIISFFCLINIFYLYDKCVEYLSNRPEVIKNLIQEQLLYASLGVWTIQSAANIYGFPLCDQFPSACPFYQADTKLDEILLEIQKKALDLRNPKYSNILSQKFKNLLYEKSQEISKDWFISGTYSAQNYLQLEMYREAFTYASPLDEITFSWNTLYMADFYDGIVNEIDSYSKSVIDNQMNIIAISLFGIIFCTFVAYIGFYLPFFRHEKRYLQKINSILKIIPIN